MNYESFKEAVLDRLSSDIPDPKHITIQKVPRNNGGSLDGLVILENGVNIAPTLYLNHYHRMLQDGSDFSAVYSRLLSHYEKNKTDSRIDAGFFTDFDRIRDRIIIKLVNREKNRVLLEDHAPYVPFLDLAIVFTCLFPVDLDIGNATILIDNSHLALWDLSADDLFPLAMENTRRLLEPQLRDINQVLHDLIDTPEYPSAAADPADSRFPMYVLSNSQDLFGASCMACDGVIRSISDRFGSGLYILPSSIHEVILVPSRENDRMREFTEMVREVNSSQVAPEDILSDHAYYYSRGEDRIIY